MKDCDYPKLFVVWIGLYALIFLVMFANFYRQAYKKSARQSSAPAKTEVNGTRPSSEQNGIKHD